MAGNVSDDYTLALVKDVIAPTITGVTVNCLNSPIIGYSINRAARVNFSEPIYSNNDGSGNLLKTTDLTLTASHLNGSLVLANYAILGTSGNAGTNQVDFSLTWSGGSLVGSEHLMADMTATSVYDEAGNAGVHVGNEVTPNWIYTNSNLSINESPSDASVCANTQATFSGSAQGDLNTNYRWEMSTNGTTWSPIAQNDAHYNYNLGNDNGATLTVNAVASDNGLKFRYVAQNLCSSAISDSAVLTVNPVSSISAYTPDTKNITVCAGSSDAHVFGVTSDGQPPMDYVWEYSTNGTDWSALVENTPENASYNVDEDSGNLSINGNIAAGNYYYHVIVKSLCGSDVTSDPFTLTINALPLADRAVSVEDADATICTGTATNVIVANSEIDVNYQLRISSSNTAVGDPVAGTGSPINLTTGNLASTTTFNVLATVATTGCDIQLTQTATVTVEQTPINATLASKIPNQAVVCEGTPVAATFTAGQGGSADVFQYRTDNGSWTTYTEGAPIATTGHTSVDIQTYRNSISCTPATPTTLASWIIETTPVAKTIVKNPDVNAVCMGTNVAATFTNGSGGSGSDEYEYRVNSGAWISYTSNTAIPTNNATLIEIRTRRLASVCSASDYTVASWTVNPLPTASISGNSTGCSSVTLTANSNAAQTSYQWIKDGGTINGATGNTYDATASGNYQVTITNTNTSCSTTSDQFAVTVSVPPTVQTVANNTICAGNIQIYLNGSEAGVTYTVYKDNANTNVTANGSGSGMFINVPNAQSGIYTIKASRGTCTDIAMTGSVTVNSVPSQPSTITGTTPVCAGTTGITYSVTNVAGVTYNWSYNGTNATIASGQGTNSITMNYASNATSGTLTVTPSNTCGNGTAQTLAVTVNNVPSQPSAISGTSPVCAGTTGITYSVTNVAGVTYNWSYNGTNATIASGQGTNSITMDYAANATSGTLTVTPSNTCGSGTAQTLAVTVNNVPSQPSTITGTTPVCAGTTGVTYNVTNVAGVTYTWSYNGTNATIASGQGTNSITMNYASNATSGTLTVTPSNTCGNGTDQTLAVTVNSVPSQPSTITGTTPVCAGTTGITYSVTNVAGVTYNWSYNGTNATIASGQGTNSITMDYASNATSGTLTVTPSNTCGNGTDQTLAVTVNSVPSQPSTITGTTPVCAGTTGITYSVTNVAGVTYNWSYNGTNATIASGQGTNSITMNYASNATSGTLTVTPSNTCGNGTAQTLAVTVNSVPSQPSTITGTTPVCANTTGITYSVTNVAGVTYNWSYNGTNATIASGQGTNSITMNYASNATSGTLTVTPSNTCGSGTAQTLAVTVNNVPSQPSTITGTSPVCAGTTGITYSVTNVAGVTYNWSYNGTNATIASGQGTNSITMNYATNATSGTLTVTPSNTCGNGTAQTLAVTVNNVPSQPSTITGTTPVCAGTTGITYSVTNVAGVTYNWSYNGTNATIASGQGTNSITMDYASNATSGTLTVTPSNTCGNGTAQTLAVTVNNVPSQPSTITGTTPVCAGTTGITYSVTNVAGVTYNWSYNGTNATIASGQGTNSITMNYASNATSGTLTVTPSNTCGNGTAQTLAVTVNSVPSQPSTITGTTPVCANTTGITYSVTNVAGVTYNWSYNGTNATIASGQGTNSITMNYASNATSGTLTVTPSNTCGSGTAQTLAVTVNSVPSQPSTITGTTPVCANTTGITYSVTNVAGVAYNWSYSGTNATIASGQGTNSITMNYASNATSGTLTVTPSNTCGNGTARTLSISIDPQSVAGTITGGTTPIDLGISTGTMTLSGYVGTIEKWQKKLSTDANWTDISNLNATYSETPSTPGTWQYRAVVKSGSCSEASSDARSIVVNSQAVVVTLTTTVTSPTKLATIPVTATFSASVTDFTASDITATNATVNGLTGSGTTYTFNLVPSAQGSFSATVNAGSVTPTNIASNTLTLTYDNVAPSAPTVTLNNSLPINNSNKTAASLRIQGETGTTYNYTISSNNGGTNITNTGILTGGDVTLSGISVTGLNDGTLTASVTLTDAANNTSLAGTNTQVKDVVLPTVTINQATSQVDPTTTSPVNFTVVFSENVTGFTNGDVTLSGTAGATTATVTGSGTTYNVAVSGMTQTGTVIATISAGIAQDAVGNTNVASTSTDNTVIFNAPQPVTVTINQASGQADPTNGSTINYTVVFSESVTGFTSEDVTLSGTATGTLAKTVTGSGTTYNVAVSGMTGSGTVIATIPAGSAYNTNNVTNNASTSTDNTVTFDISAPYVTLNGYSPVSGGTIALSGNLALTFNEPVAISATGALTIKRMSDSSIVASFNASSQNIVVNSNVVTFNSVPGLVNATQYYVEINNGFVKDLAGNSYAGITGYTTWSFIVPSVTPNAPNAASISNRTRTTIYVSIDKPADTKVMVVVRKGTTSTVYPANAFNESQLNGHQFTDNLQYGSGSDLGYTDANASDCYVAYCGTESAITITNCIRNTYYSIAVYAYDGVSGLPATYTYNPNEVIASNKTLNKETSGDQPSDPDFSGNFEVSNVNPNPVSNDINFNITNSVALQFNVELYNSVGSLVMSKSLNLGVGTHPVTLPITSSKGNLAAGKYFLKVSSGSDVLTQPIVILP